MNELMKVQEKTPIEIALGIDEEGYTTSKKLYEFLELDPSHYSRWCNRNIINNVFAEEGVDYFIENSPAGRATVGRGNTVDYKLSSNFAKELSVLADNPRGILARNYFRNCEIALKKSVSKLEEENKKLQLLTLSPEMKFMAMNPKFLALESALGLSRKELYSLIYKNIEENYHISISKEVLNYCIDHHIPSCYTMTVLEDVSHLFLFLYDTVENMLKQLEIHPLGELNNEPLSVTTIESIS